MIQTLVIQVAKEKPTMVILEEAKKFTVAKLTDPGET